jgi:ferritin-like metal-binding protein YciE
MPIASLDDLLIEELKDLYSAEQQITKALPKMAAACNSTELRQAFELHLKQTEEHIVRLDRCFEKLGASSKGKLCRGMEGLIKEAEEFIQEKPAQDVVDAGLISLAQRVEHYEIAGYGSCRAYCEELGHNEVAKWLQTTLDEEGATDKKLTRFAEQRGINREARKAA